MVKDALARWWAGRTTRMVVVLAIVVRVAALGELLFVLPVVAPHAKYPAAAWLLGAALLAETAVVVTMWIRADRLSQTVMAFDLAWNAAAIVAGGVIAPQGTWADFAYPYTTLISFTLGLANRRMSVAVLAGTFWATAAAAVSLVLNHAGLLAVFVENPAYVGNPVLGRVCAALLTKTFEELRTAEKAAVEHAGALGTQRARAWYSRVLHDRSLQTLEALARPGWLDDIHRAEAAAQAAWLRRFVETGKLGTHDELVILLEAAVYRANRSGVRVELNAAHLRHLSDETRAVSRPARLAIVHAVIEILGALPSTADHVTIRIQPDSAGLLVTLLVAGRKPAEWDAGSTDRIRAHVQPVSGRFDASGFPHLTLWVPDNPAAVSREYAT